MPQPLESGIDGHQRGDNLHPLMSGTATPVNLPGNLVEVVPHAGKLTKQRRRDRRKFAYTRWLLVQARLAHPGCELFTLAALQQTPVLILDDFLMASVPLDDLTNLLEVMEERQQLGSLIVTTQYPIAEWHRLIPDPTLADAICDRLAHTSVVIRLQGESMRKHAAAVEPAANNIVT